MPDVIAFKAVETHLQQLYPIIDRIRINNDISRSHMVKINSNNDKEYYRQHMYYKLLMLTKDQKMFAQLNKTMVANASSYFLAIQKELKIPTLRAPQPNWNYEGMLGFFRTGVPRLKEFGKSLSQLHTAAMAQGDASKKLAATKFHDAAKLFAECCWLTNSFYVSLSKSIMNYNSVYADSWRVQVPSTISGIVLARFGYYGTEQEELYTKVCADELNDWMQALAMLPTVLSEEVPGMARRFVEGVVHTMCHALPPGIALQFDGVIDVLDPWNMPISVCGMFGAILHRWTDQIVARYGYAGGAVGIGRNTMVGITLSQCNADADLSGWAKTGVALGYADAATNIVTTYNTTLEKVFRNGFDIGGHLQDISQLTDGSSIQVGTGVPIAVGGGLPFSVLLTKTGAWQCNPIFSKYSAYEAFNRGALTVTEIVDSCKDIAAKVWDYYNVFRQDRRNQITIRSSSK